MHFDQRTQAALREAGLSTDEIRGYLRFDTWGVSVADGRILSEDSVELTLGPTVHDRVRFAADRDAL